MTFADGRCSVANCNSTKVAAEAKKAMKENTRMFYGDAKASLDKLLPMID